MNTLSNHAKNILKVDKFKKWYRIHIRYEDGLEVKRHINALTERGAKKILKEQLSYKYEVVKVEIVD